MNTGDFVQSKAGRDQGRVFIVTDCNDTYAYLCDGVLRKQDKPKKKKVKHIKGLDYSDADFRAKLLGGEKLTNADYRKAVQKCQETLMEIGRR